MNDEKILGILSEILEEQKNTNKRLDYIENKLKYVKRAICNLKHDFSDIEQKTNAILEKVAEIIQATNSRREIMNDKKSI